MPNANLFFSDSTSIQEMIESADGLSEKSKEYLLEHQNLDILKRVAKNSSSLNLTELNDQKVSNWIYAKLKEGDLSSQDQIYLNKALTEKNSATVKQSVIRFILINTIEIVLQTLLISKKIMRIGGINDLMTNTAKAAVMRNFSIKLKEAMHNITFPKASDSITNTQADVIEARFKNSLLQSSQVLVSELQRSSQDAHQMQLKSDAKNIATKLDSLSIGKPTVDYLDSVSTFLNSGAIQGPLLKEEWSNLEKSKQHYDHIKDLDLQIKELSSFYSSLKNIKSQGLKSDQLNKFICNLSVKTKLNMIEDLPGSSVVSHLGELRLDAGILASLEEDSAFKIYLYFYVYHHREMSLNELKGLLKDDDILKNMRYLSLVLFIIGSGLRFEDKQFLLNPLYREYLSILAEEQLQSAALLCIFVKESFLKAERLETLSPKIFREELANEQKLTFTNYFKENVMQVLTKNIEDSIIKNYPNNAVGKKHKPMPSLIDMTLNKLLIQYRFIHRDKYSKKTEQQSMPPSCNSQ